MKKKLPKLTSDEEAEAFVARSDLTEYDLSAMQMVRFEREKSSVFLLFSRILLALRLSRAP
jgi:predicted DNA binding CopG/RHH family protein